MLTFAATLGMEVGGVWGVNVRCYVGDGGGVGWGMLTFAGTDVMKLMLPC